MAVVFLGNDTNGYDATQSGDLHILPEGRYLTHTGDAFDFGTYSGTLVVNGQIASELDGVDADFHLANQVEVVVNPSGSIVGQSDGVELSGLIAQVVNHGAITGFGDNGVELIGNGTSQLRSVLNTGTITGVDSGVVITGSNATDVARGGSVSNSGTITGQNAVGTLSSLNLVNTGDIIGDLSSPSSTGFAYGVLVFSNTFEKTVKVQNSGTISGSTAALLSAVKSTEIIENSGRFFGDLDLLDQNDSYKATSTGVVQGSIVAGLGNDTIVNAGSITGDVNLGTGNDHFDGRGGTVSGQVLGGAGDDTFIVDDPTLALVENAAEGTDLVRAAVSWSLGANVENLDLLGAEALNGTGNTAANTITGNAGANRISGLGGNDSLLGGDGEDVIFGGAGNDSLRGGDGDDDLRGQSGNDNIRGQNGDDRVVGNGGNDRLFGDAGRDTIIGGAGEDTLYGGTEADLFVYRTVSDSPTGTGRDKIQGFELGLDQIDLRQIAPGTLGFVGTGALSGSGPEVQLVTFGGTNTRIRIDADGNGSIDMLIDVIGATGMSEADFLL